MRNAQKRLFCQPEFQHVFLIAEKQLKNYEGTADSNSKQKPLTRKPTIKCVLVGDGSVGKTNLILTYLENRFVQEHIPTASDIYNGKFLY